MIRLQTTKLVVKALIDIINDCGDVPSVLEDNRGHSVADIFPKATYWAGYLGGQGWPRSGTRREKGA
jgi:hypothetical protein